MEGLFSSLKTERTEAKTDRASGEARADVSRLIERLQHDPLALDHRLRQPG